MKPTAVIICKRTPSKDKEEVDDGQFKIYYDFKQLVVKIQPFQYLAICRAESLKKLTVVVEIAHDVITTFKDRALQILIRDAIHDDPLHPPRAQDDPTKQSSKIIDYAPLKGFPQAPIHPPRPPPKNDTFWYSELDKSVEDGLKRLVIPSIKRDIRRSLYETAHQKALTTFQDNVRCKLMMPPLRLHPEFLNVHLKKYLLGIDPGFGHGCKYVVITVDTGDIVTVGTVYPHINRPDRANTEIKNLFKKYDITFIVIGNGTACQETIKWINTLIENNRQIAVTIVDEGGASVYSASPIALEELPHMDITHRSAVSIARRVIDPLGELIKIDPWSLGVGLYQHDGDQKSLHLELNEAVSWAVNAVGVDVNIASYRLLCFVSGIGPALAKSIVAHREVHGPYSNRADLMRTRGMGPKSYTQSVGFLRVLVSDDPLDATV
eukprot:GHVL01009385.1.p1 GENE.GHVL01009385.1~~GHVL01009385.1.p1  ORF type:complete len:436 (+),score=98.18 GHVL01009385.1:783-2090(+)